MNDVGMNLILITKEIIQNVRKELRRS
jgi:vacuolar-type H+-ATPase subunit F/Vma7